MDIRAEQSTYSEAAEPCRNFNILGVVSLIDPKDGREKLVLSNFAAGSVGNLIFIDTKTHEGETIPLPGDSGAWAILPLGDKLLVGTCPDYGYLHSLDLRKREWAKPLRIESEKYIWNFALGSDGRVYGGTYPGCVLLRYDPEKHELANVGRVSEHAKNMYSRHVYGLSPGRIIVGGGMDTPFLRVWDIGSETFGDFGAAGETVKQITDSFICTAQGDRLRFYETATLEPVEGGLAETWSAMVENKEIALNDRLRVGYISLADGSKAGVKGQDYFIQQPGDNGRPEFRPIPVLAPATRIHTVISDGEGVLWGSSGFGQTIFRYDPRDGSYWNSGAVCNAGGEVYGMAFVGDELFMAAYAGGDHIVYRPSEPWDQYGNVNPRTLRPVGPELIRPHGKTVVGPDGGIWTGWMAKYGVYGGGLSRIDAVTKEVTSWYDPVPGQEIGGLTADAERLYFTTGTGGNGLKARDEPAHFAVWEPEGRISFLHRFDSGERGGVLLAAASYVWIRVGNEIAVFDPRTLVFVQRLPLGEGCGCIIADGPDRIAAFGQKTLFSIDVKRMTAEPLGALPGNVSTAARTPDGTLYFNCYGTKLYKRNAAGNTR
jgi:sugar lactone lactonase YvrE